VVQTVASGDPIHDLAESLGKRLGLFVQELGLSQLGCCNHLHCLGDLLRIFKREDLFIDFLGSSHGKVNLSLCFENGLELVENLFQFGLQIIVELSAGGQLAHKPFVIGLDISYHLAFVSGHILDFISI